MTDTPRDSLIDSYFDALDEEETSILEPSLAETFVYESLSETFDGFEGFETYMHEYRTFSGTDHRITNRIHDDGGSVVEGVVVGYGEADEQIEAAFCDVFEFTGDDEAITRITVYLNDQIDPDLFEA